MKPTSNPDEPIIELVEVTCPDGSSVWVPQDDPLAFTANTERAKAEEAIEDRPTSRIPRERFAATNDPDGLAAMIRQIREAESGRNVPVPVVQADGKIRPTAAGQHENVASVVPRERFAAAPSNDTAAIHALDPQNECDWIWFDDVRGWTFALFPDVFHTAEYRFFVRQDPARRNEWFAYVIAPNLDEFVGHRHHLQALDGQTVVCLRPGFRGHESLAAVHGALAKWCVYMEFILRGLPAPFSA